MLAERFRSMDRKADALYTSDLLRAKETAEIIGRAIHKNPVLAPALREIHLGAWEGYSIAEITQLFPQEWARMEAGEDVARGGGETYGIFQKRVMVWLETTASASLGKSIIVVTHGGCIRSVLLGIRRLTWSQRHLIPAIENSSITHLQFSPAGWSIVEDADTNHLLTAGLKVTPQVTLDEGKIV
jgi:broad specificity phosphatase PhoE